MLPESLYAVDNGTPVYTGQGNSAIDKDAFMQLLVAQMKNQDPTNPTGNEELAAQLAQFSSLEQLEQMNENLTVMALLNQDNALLSQLSESSNLIGKQVDWQDGELGTSGQGVVDAVKVIEGVTYLVVGDNSVPLALVTDVTAAPDGDVVSVDETDESEEVDEVDSDDGTETGESDEN